VDRLARAEETHRHLNHLYATGSTKLTLQYLVLAVEYLAILANYARAILTTMKERDE